MNTDQDTDINRRRFLSGAAGAAGLAVAPGVVLHMTSANARPADEPVTGAKRWGMLIDTAKCASGCDACVRACEIENGWGGTRNNELESAPGQQSQWIRKVQLRDKATGYTNSLPMMCQHCAHPPCVDVCPTGASFRRADGIVLVDKHICIGCRYCMMACPYKARSFIHEDLENQLPHAPRGKGTVESCTFCVHRIDRNGTEAIPACAEACDADGHEAMVFGDLNDPNSHLSQSLTRYGGEQLRRDLNLDLGIRYRNI